MTAIYEALAADGRVLYVGMTDDLPRRQREHAASSAWFPLVAMWRADEVEQSDARAEEWRRIGSLRPVFNVAGNHPRSTELGLPFVASSRDRKAMSLRALRSTRRAS